jgi:hypothetical protein
VFLDLTCVGEPVGAIGVVGIAMAGYSVHDLAHVYVRASVLRVGWRMNGWGVYGGRFRRCIRFGRCVRIGLWGHNIIRRAAVADDQKHRTKANKASGGDGSVA